MWWKWWLAGLVRRVGHTLNGSEHADRHGWWWWFGLDGIHDEAAV